MLKRDYLLLALNNKAYVDAQWLISILSLTMEDPSKEQDDYPFKLVKGEDGYYFLDQNLQKVRLEDATNTQESLFTYSDYLTITSDEVPHLTHSRSIETTVGNLIQNYLVLYHPFGTKIEYINRRFKASEVEEIVLARKSFDTPARFEDRDPNKIYFDEYETFCSACIHLTQLNNVCVPSLTYKAMTPPPGAKERLAELMEIHKDKLDDPVVLATISKELEAMDKEYLKGDRSSGFLISKKDLAVVRKKLFLTYGDVKGFKKGNKVDFLPKPLVEGLDYAKFDIYNNDARAGSYSRGAETQLGGVSVKELLRASSNLSIDEEDCGSTHGQKYFLNEKNLEMLKGFTAITPKGQIKITDETKAQLLNQTYPIRFPNYCKTAATGFCSTCVGPHLNLHPNGLSEAVSDVGNVLLYMFMKAMHGKEAANQRLDLKEIMS